MPFQLFAQQWTGETSQWQYHGMAQGRPAPHQVCPTEPISAPEGRLVAEHMRCLMALNRPVEGPMRTVDLFPLVLKHLGHDAPVGIDGVLDQGDARVASSVDPS